MTFLKTVQNHLKTLQNSLKWSKTVKKWSIWRFWIVFERKRSKKRFCPLYLVVSKKAVSENHAGGRKGWPRALRGRPERCSQQTNNRKQKLAPGPLSLLFKKQKFYVPQHKVLICFTETKITEVLWQFNRLFGKKKRPSLAFSDLNRSDFFTFTKKQKKSLPLLRRRDTCHGAERYVVFLVDQPP